LINLAVLGATGRMGQAILSCVAESKSFRLSGAVTVVGDPALGRDAGEYAGLAPFGVPLTDDRAQALNRARVAVDFTLPAALEANLQACREAGTPLVVGTTGLSANHQRLLEQSAREIPIVYARNMSVAMNVFMHFVGRAAAALGEDYDVEIVEAHHRNKVDAPSGTALALGEAVAAARNRKLAEVAVFAREGQTGPRVPGTIGFAAIRGGNIVGDHSVLFVAPDESVEFTHRAFDRRAFALGALRAASWLAGRAPGLYSMTDVLDLE
jgi:4-hydroxy-tetrahydrodipicolinate reductase